MLLDFILASAHHILIFTLAAVIVAEIVLLRSSLTVRDVTRLARVDLHYGAAAGLLLLIGFARVHLGAKPADFYYENPLFWLKIALFVAVGLLSVPPTLRFIRWRKATKASPDALPLPDEVASIRRYVVIEAVLFLAIPVAAAAMARGYGL